MEETLISQAVIVTAFILVHLFAGRLKSLGETPRSIWLSLAGGTSVAYVFVHALPELGHYQSKLTDHWQGLRYLEHHAYLVALAGMITFYGVEKMIRDARRKRSSSTTGYGAFWLHLTSFGVYNGLVGYLLVHRDDQSTIGLYTYAFAMALHFLVNDFGLRFHHQETYQKAGRWVLAGAIVLGWSIGLTTKVSEPLVGVLFAFLAGGIILNVLKEELPEEKESRLWPFAGGAVVYAAVLLVI